MRRSLAIALIAAVAVAPIIALHPPPTSIPPDAQPAQHLSTVEWASDERWFGGFSGIEVAQNGESFFAVTDRGRMFRGTFNRDDQRLTGVGTFDVARLVDDGAKILRGFHTDAEGLALDGDGRLYVSFEHANRILRYNGWEAPANWPSYTTAWRALRMNGGLEMVAVDGDGTLFTIPEGVARGAYEALVYRRAAQQEWDQPFTLPLSEGFAVVGGDFGPDGRLYVLERGFTPYGFRSQVRRMTVTDTGFEDIQIILQTPPLRHGNIEGLAVWKDRAGRTRLTMISDDNFLPLLRTNIIEYVVNE